MNNKKIVLSLVVILTFLVTHYFTPITTWLGLNLALPKSNPYIYNIAWKLLRVSPALLVLWVIFRQKLITIIGLNHSPVKALGLALLFWFPVLIIFAIYYPLSTETDPYYLFNGSLMAGFWEELLFRALLFGSLCIGLGWNFWAAVFISGLPFAAGHLYQANDTQSALLTIAVTLIGAIWFSWLYYRWNANLWIPMFLHILLNLSWAIFDVGSGAAAGGLVSFGARLLVIALSVWLTIKLTNKPTSNHRPDVDITF